MSRKVVKGKGQDKARVERIENGAKAISYRLRCSRTANGLSHYVMYGDADKKAGLL